MSKVKEKPRKPKKQKTSDLPEKEIQIIKPQAGPQENFLSSSADIVFYGGAAGGGKTFALLLEGLRNINNKKFGAICFRRTAPQISAEGGLWDSATSLYPHVGATMKESPYYRATFPSGSKIEFRQLQHEKNKLDYQGSQIPLILYDELTQFSWSTFVYLLSRNRSTCGVKPYIRATCNPDPDSWVADFISWYIDQITGYAIPERSGVIRFFVVQKDGIIWGDTKKELYNYIKLGKKDKKAGLKKDDLIKSFSFISSSIYDNQELLKKNPGYLGNLNSLPLVEREQLLKGNWKIKRIEGDYFKKEWFTIVRNPDKNIIKIVRYWDRAATEPNSKNPDPDWTVGIKMAIGKDKKIYVLDMVRFRGRPAKVQKAIDNIANQDGFGVQVWLEQDPAQAGIVEIEHLIKNLSGYNVKKNKVSKVNKAKEKRAIPASAQAEIGNIYVVKAPWNDIFFYELEAFPSSGVHDDIVDSFSGGFFALTRGGSLIDYEEFTQ